MSFGRKFFKPQIKKFMWYGQTSQPAQHRYDLPVLSGVTAIKVSEA